MFQILIRAYIISNSIAVQRGILFWIRLRFNCYRLITSMDYILASLCQRYRAKTATVDWSLGSQGKREKEINRRHRERREKSMASFFLLIASRFLLRTAGKVSVRAWTEISLSVSLSCYLSLSLSLLLISSLSGLLILFLPFLDILHLQSHDCCEDRSLEPMWSSH